MRQVIPELGGGIYTATDASKILSITYPKVSYWFRRYVRGEFELHSDFKYFFNNQNVTAVNFYTLIEIFVFDFFKQNKISTKRIVTAHRELGRLLNTPYPFCHTDVLLSSGESIILKYKGNLIEASPGFQHALAEYVMPYARKIEFLNQMAHKYYPLGKDHSIVVNPNNQYGTPIIDGTNIKLSSIASLIRGEESYTVIKKLYDLTDNQFDDILTFLNAA